MKKFSEVIKEVIERTDKQKEIERYERRTAALERLGNTPQAFFPVGQMQRNLQPLNRIDKRFFKNPFSNMNNEPVIRSALKYIHDIDLFKSDNAQNNAKEIGRLLVTSIKDLMKANPERVQGEIIAICEELVEDWARHGNDAVIPWSLESIHDIVLNQFVSGIIEIMPDDVITIAVSPLAFRFCEENDLYTDADSTIRVTLSPNAQRTECGNGAFREKLSLFIPDDKIDLLLEQLPTIKCSELKRFWFDRYINGKMSMKEFFGICESIVPQRKGAKGWNYNNFKSSGISHLL